MYGVDGTAEGPDGVPGRLAGAVMARLNRDVEVAAVVELAPVPGDAELDVGFGPAVGIAELVAPARRDARPSGTDAPRPQPDGTLTHPIEG